MGSVKGGIPGVISTPSTPSLSDSRPVSVRQRTTHGHESKFGTGDPRFRFRSRRVKGRSSRCPTGNLLPSPVTNGVFSSGWEDRVPEPFETGTATRSRVSGVKVSLRKHFLALSTRPNPGRMSVRRTLASRIVNFLVNVI